MMCCNDILYEKSEGIAWITLNRPEQMNALNAKMILEWKDAVVKASEDREVGVIVITGAGRSYCTGMDLKELEKMEFKDGEIGSIYDIPANELINTMQAVPKTVIAMVNGPCITGGLETLLGMDLVVAAENAKFGDTHARWGIRPSWGMSQRLPRIVGWRKGKDLSFTARIFTAREAFDMGLVNRVVPADQLKATVVALAKDILKNSRETIAAIKHLYNKGMDLSLEEGLKMEAQTKFTITDTNERLRRFIHKKQ